MKVFALCAVIGALSLPAVFQTTTPTAKPTTKPTAKKSTAKAKTTSTPSKAATAARPKATLNKPDEKVEWERVTSIADRTERITALEKFVKAFPKGPHLNEANGLLAAAHVDSGNELVTAGNNDGAAADYKTAIKVVPTPVVQGFWDEGLAKIPSNLFFHGAREAALEMAKLLEDKAAGPQQQLSIATFYLTIEDGTNAKRIAEKVIATDAASGPAYRTLGLAARVDFDLEAAAAAFAKALELDPESLETKQSLAEMKRALGRSEEALTLYQDILTKDPQNIAARTGKVMALFEADKRSDAETELASTLEAAPANVILLASAAYWYAAHRSGEKAVEYAQKAIEEEPRFVWSYVALARGFLLEGRAADAERTLFTARRYGNFPTLDYELAATRLAGGYYREAAEALSGAFQVKDGAVTTNLGGRIPRSSTVFTDVVSDERRASIFAPTAADDTASAAKLVALLEFRQQMSADKPDRDAVVAAAEKFVEGSDPMQAHRQLFAASQLLEKKVALDKASELARAAVSGVDAAVTVPAASSAVMASEIYAARREAALRGEYVNVPDIPKATQSAILRGRIEDIIGWTEFQSDHNDESIVHLKRAVNVLPTDSAWWRTSSWHLGTALALAGKDTEALDNYIKSYKGTPPDAIRYSVIEALYKKVNGGSSDGLAQKIGENPAVAVNTRADMPSPTPQSTPESTPEPTPTPKPQPTPDYVTAIPRATPLPTLAPSPEPTPEPSPLPTPRVEESPSPSPSPAATPEQTPVPSPTPDAAASPTPEPSTALIPEPSITPVSEPSPTPAAITTETPSPSPTPETTRTPADTVATTDSSKARELFPPVIITIPKPTRPRVSASPTPTPNALAESGNAASSEPAVVPCNITVSEDSISLRSMGGDLAVIVGRDDDANIDDVEAVSSSPPDILVRREPIAGVRTRALFVFRSRSQKTGLFEVSFTLPCGKRSVAVRVR